ncbi:MAG: S-layer homology domain-containing protein, partial [Vallitaleaceae bacterium]|nr:S-layer homology domain-containing protein [Vallitaleaceae bacterium]
VIGLERLGVTGSPMTPFVDDAKIAAWAKKEIMAGFKLGIIKGDQEGKVQPTKWMSKVEAAAIINRLIDYLREEISLSYRK